MPLSFMEGNEAIAWGAVSAGCTFFAGYPITPATTILNSMLQHLPPRGGVCMQGEDEIASIGFCLGASMAGHKVMTATSGPGISLYSEQISFAIGSEIPIVIVNVQRLGPSTGSATRGADGDIQFMRWGNSGGLPVVVLAPVDIADAVTLTMHAFNLAERLRCPVFIAANKELSMTRESIDLAALDMPEPVTRLAAPADQPYLPFGVTEGRQVPAFRPIGAPQLSRQTSSTHAEDGYITVDSEIIQQFQDRLYRKVSGAVADFSFHTFHPRDGARTLLISYGVTARAAQVAVDTMNRDKQPVAHLILKTLWPVPETLIRDYAQNYDRVVMVEMNMGQYVREIRRLLPTKTVDFWGLMNGNLITPQQIREVLRNE